MMKFHLPMILAAMLFAAPAVHAQVTVSEPWVRATVADQKVTGAFMKITSPVEAKLVEIRSAQAGRAEIHEMAMDGGTMKMRQVLELPLPAGMTVELKPGGLHVMLFDLAAQAKEGGTVPLTLVVEAGGKREAVEVSAAVRPVNKHTH
jgi:copper(I)-binding protein